MHHNERSLKIWTEILKEAFESYSIGESADQFQYRMEKKGIVVDYRAPTGCAGKTDRDFYETVIRYLNAQAGTKFRVRIPSANATVVLNQRKAGMSLEDFKAVIDKKCPVWKGTPYQEALTPGHLFGKQMENYLGQLSAYGVAGAGKENISAIDRALAEVKQSL